MFSSLLIFVVSTALMLFYLQATCEKILRRRFAETRCAEIMHAYRLEFASLKEALERPGGPEWAKMESALQGDFLSLVCLLRNACNTSRRMTKDERLLMTYFRLTFFCLRVRHAFRLSESSSVQKLTSILQYFSNVLAVRMNAVRAGQIEASDYLLSS